VCVLLWGFLFVYFLITILKIIFRGFSSPILRNLKRFSLMSVGCFAKFFVSFFVELVVLCYLKECDPTYVSTLDLFLSLPSRPFVRASSHCYVLPLLLTLAMHRRALLGVQRVPRICHLCFRIILHERGATY